MSFELTLAGGRPHEVEVARHGERATVTIDGRDFVAALRGEPDARMLTFEARAEPVWVVAHHDTAWVHALGRAWEIALVDPFARVLAGGVAEDIAAAPMPGTVITVAVEAGGAIRAGQPMVVIESMKMQSEIVAVRDGVVGQVFVAVGDTFDRGAPLIALEPGEAPEGSATEDKSDPDGRSEPERRD